MIRLLMVALMVAGCFAAYSQGVRFGSSDTAMTRAFGWAKKEALHYKGRPGDVVGPWYESALPPRNAFCMRDVSHQSVGGAILGLDAENRNMLHLFARNISAAKNWCSYWEMDKNGGPSPADFRSDREFWYNLIANFDLISATWRLATWTGDSTYIEDPVFRNFQEKTVGPYIESWVLEADSLLTRPAHPNAPAPYHDSDAFDRCRGLPSYSEGIPNMKMGVDLVAALFRGLMTYADILRQRGQITEASVYAQKAEQYRMHLEADWWDDSLGRYHTWYSDDDRFGLGEGETFLLWFDALRDTARARRTINHLAAVQWNVENTSYLAYLFYREGYWDLGRRTILYLSDPHTPRREYPEVSFGVVEAVVMGLMGIGAEPESRTVSSLYHSRGGGYAWLEDLPLLGTAISIRHTGQRKSVLSNRGARSIVWKAEFAGVHTRAMVGGRAIPMNQERNRWGDTISFVEVPVVAGGQAVVAL
jgi:hypothetical protein